MVVNTVSDRRVFDVIDGNGVFGARAVAAGPWLFFSGTAVDSGGTVQGVDSLPAAYRNSPAADVRTQTAYLFSEYAKILESVDSTFENVLQIEQLLKNKVHHDGYLEISRGPTFMARRRPSSMLVQGGAFLPAEAVVNVNGFALIPDRGVGPKEIFRTDLLYAGSKHSRPGVGLPPEKFPEFYEDVSDEAPFSEVVAAGPYVFNTVFATDYLTGPHPDVRVSDWSAWGSEMRNEALWMGMALKTKLEAAGASLDDVIHCTALLGEIQDVYELDLVWARLFPSGPPARTVVPVRGFNQPRHEGAKHHWEGSEKMELQFRTFRHGHGATREVLSLDGGLIPTESAAVRVGDLLWIGGQIAADERGLTAPADDPDAQAKVVLDRVSAICEAGGTTLSELLRIRAYVTEDAAGRAFYSSLKSRLPENPPTVSVAVVPAPLQVNGCTILVDAVAYAP